ncbi:MAG TPA: DUF72 domain-containing protein [Thermoanaerobaculia bacterium]|nr:DUF72 domain-containing protein [Thermoanaerobaculia bacterium]
MIRLGLCGFTINAAEYFQTFDTLEVQQTFYEPPSRETMARWRDQAPAGFVFTIKAWQIITHRSTSSTYKRLRTRVENKEELGGFQLNDTTLRAWKVTRDCARLLRAKAILFQCPASFRATEENLDNMRRFFGAVDRLEGVEFLFEPRGAWPDEVIIDICRELDLVHTVDPFLRPSLTPELLYWRLHGIGTHYRPYTEEELRDLVTRLPRDAEGYVMFNNIPRVGDAKKFRELLAER